MLTGSGRNDTLIGSAGRDAIDGGRGNDRLFGGARNDTLTGGAGRDWLDGGSGNDRLMGGRHNDILIGGTGRDRLDGGVGNDRLIGGEGADRMTGGAGADTFVFVSARHLSTGTARDVITDFHPGQDKIALPSSDAFSVLLPAHRDFDAPGQLRYDARSGILSGNTDADATPEFEILLANKPSQLLLGRDISPTAPAPAGPLPAVTPLPASPSTPPPVLPPVVPREPATSAYDRAIGADRPVLFLPLAEAERGAREADMAHPDRSGTYHNHVTATPLPNDDQAAVFDGLDSYLELPDAPDLSVPTTGILTIEAWLRPDVLIFPKQQGSGYLHWLGKGELHSGTEPDQVEWAARIYGADNTDTPSCENRISGYAFNLEGGRGIGSYFQDPLTPGTWIHYVLVINTTPQDPQDAGYTRIYRDGSNLASSGKEPWDDMDSLLEYWPDPTTPHRIVPADGLLGLEVVGLLEEHRVDLVGRHELLDRDLAAASTAARPCRRR